MRRPVSTMGAATLAAAIVLLAACTPAQAPTPATPTTPESRFPNWPGLLNDFRFHWSAAAGVDLTTGPAVIVRAYSESYSTAQLTFDRANVYPGFLRATPENQPREGDYQWQLVGIRPLSFYTGELPEPHQQFGYFTKHLLELEPTASGYRATVCTGEYTSFIKAELRPDAFIALGTRETKDGVAPYPDTPLAGVLVQRIDIVQDDPRNPSGGSAPVSTPQRGPAPAPSRDVFGNWFVTAASTKFWGPADNPEDFPSTELRQRCADAMPDDQAGRLEMMTGYKSEPPPHGAPVPGWPAEPS